MADELPMGLRIAGTLVEMAGTTVTAMALIVGGTWAYFKFVKSREFRPRLDVAVTGRWIDVESRPHFLVRVTVKNIGTSDVQLLETGSGLRVCTLDEPLPGRTKRVWKQVAIVGVLRESQWLEPQERVSDEVLLDLRTTGPVPCQLEARMIGKDRRSAQNLETFGRTIIPPTAADDREKTEAEHDR